MVSTLPRELAGATCACRALLCPPAPNVYLACSHCREDVGEVYFRKLISAKYVFFLQAELLDLTVLQIVAGAKMTDLSCA